MQQLLDSPWNSFEVIKLLVSGLTPLIIAFIGLYLNRMLKKFENIQWKNQKLIEKRLLLYDELAPLINDLLCYFTYIGSWKDFTPEEIIQMKRLVDKKIHISAPLFSKEFYFEISTFINLCFKTFQGWGQNAKLSTDSQRRREVFGDKWDNKWDSLFVSSIQEITNPKQIKESYSRVMQVFSDDIGITENIAK